MKKGSVVIIALVALVLIFVATSVFFFMQSKKDKVLNTPNQTQQTQSPSISSPQLSPANEMANWRTYSEKSIGLTFKYPETWSIDLSDRYRLITSKNTTQKATGDFTPGFASISVDARALTEEEILNNIPGVIKTEQVIVDGVQAKKLSGSEGIAGSVQFVTVVAHPKDTYVYTISFLTQDTDLLKELIYEFDQIISTVKFVPIVN